MKLHRHPRRVVLFSCALVLSSCTSVPNFLDPPSSEYTEATVVTELPGGLTGVINQIDQAREVGADLEQRNTSLEYKLP